MPYTKKLIEKRPSAGNAASHIRAVLRQLPEQTMYPQLRSRVEKALNEALHVLTASVDYDDDDTLLGVVGEYESMAYQDPNYVGWGCRGLGLDHRWQKSEFTNTVFCTKCCEPRRCTDYGGQCNYEVPPYGTKPRCVTCGSGVPAEATDANT